ncbi:hypothetical protein GUITHDRAFT_72782 [Guillardia theta CCMP2712]|uniref:non-specific serine/threonine protein kinase n=1 Tax=Guillardia theta (strain CCMP2712) TaxID=905079 RepID=L1J5U9_GUITC|nr:hypothetical protein GUITHDRAFT_72782 [Guillardia theta CCMP2712]EKX43707.1 hypothetical protein GUITHDRAFT_72782 [Guillardia theta CCMP2712]|eukprot:XP_005830687.1 hypothetical protein GUITHDRAFT_72782 [Guillardia theta CCMP2712]
MGRGDFELGKELGKGAQGCVYRARNKLDGSVVAIKAVELSRMSRKMREEAAHEVRVLSRLRHEHVIRYLSSFQEGMTLYIVTEIAEGGTMYEMIKRQTRMLQEKQVWKYVIQTALGLLHIHSQRILHRDVKTMNIFLTKTGDVKLGDLGVAKILDNTMDMAMTMVGTPYYLSPELCEGRAYNEKSDVWSLGCVLYELCTFKHPFEAANHGALVLKIVRGRYLPIPSSYSQVMTRIVDDCLQKDVRSRPTTEELLRSPLLAPFVSITCLKGNWPI